MILSNITSLKITSRKIICTASCYLKITSFGINLLKITSLILDILKFLLNSIPYGKSIPTYQIDYFIIHPRAQNSVQNPSKKTPGFLTFFA